MAGTDTALQAAAKPTTPRWLAFFLRVVTITIIILVGQWVRNNLGGVSSDPTNANGVFNWHPVLMTLGFVVFMTEALLAYKAPVSFIPLSRPMSKKLHFACHVLSLTCIIFGLIAVFKFHEIKGFANLYSPHSFLGLTTAVLLGIQFLLGFMSYVWPKTSLKQRVAFGPVHGFLGLFTWSAGLAAIATGLQEKVAFVQPSLPPGGLFSATVRLPAATEILLLLLAFTVLYVHAFYSNPVLIEPATSGGVGLLDATSASLDSEVGPAGEYDRT